MQFEEEYSNKQAKNTKKTQKKTMPSDEDDDTYVQNQHKNNNTPEEEFLFPEPLKFISFNGKGVVKLEPKADKMLTKVLRENRDLKVKVVSIIGTYREGKSYFMNRLFGVSNGFALGPSMDPETKDVWIWAKKANNPYTKCSEILIGLDTEGLDDPKVHALKYARLYCFLVMISSTLVINHLNIIKAGDLDKLNFASKLTQMIVPSNEKNDKESSSEEIAQIMPNILFLVRDHHLIGKEDNERKKIIDALTHEPKKSEDEDEDEDDEDEDEEEERKSKRISQDKGQKTREHFRKLAELKKIHVKFLCKPVADDEVLCHMEDVPIDSKEIKPLFTTQLEATMDLVTEISKPKEFSVLFKGLNGKKEIQGATAACHIDCSSFVLFTRLIVDAINEKKVVIPDLFDTICDLKKTEALKEIKDFTNMLESELQKKIPFKSTTDRNNYFISKRSEIHKKVASSIGTPLTLVLEADAEGNAMFDGFEKEMIRLDEKECEKKNQNIQNQLEGDFKLFEGSNAEDYRKKVVELENSYKTKAYGEIQESLPVFTRTLRLVLDGKLKELDLSEMERKIELANHDAAAIKLENQQVKEEMARTQEEHKKSLLGMENNIDNLKKTMQEKELKYAQMKEDMTKDYDKRSEAMREEFDQKFEALKREQAKSNANNPASHWWAIMSPDGNHVLGFFRTDENGNHMSGIGAGSTSYYHNGYM